MGYSIQEIEGIGPEFGKKLAKAKITNTDAFLRDCSDKKGRKAVSAATGISESHLLKWANLADLMRIRGIGPQFSELLEAAGVDTVKELRHRRPDNLSAKMGEVNAKKKLTRVVPAIKQVEGWVAAAKGMDPKISH